MSCDFGIFVITCVSLRPDAASDKMPSTVEIDPFCVLLGISNSSSGIETVALSDFTSYNVHCHLEGETKLLSLLCLGSFCQFSESSKSIAISVEDCDYAFHWLHGQYRAHDPKQFELCPFLQRSSAHI